MVDDTAASAAREGSTVSSEVEDAMPPEAAAVVEEYIPGPAELAVIDPSDQHELMIRMDEHDVRMLLERVQSSALKKWVYELPYGGGTGLTVHAVQDVTALMNWTGKCRIGVLHETLAVEQIMADEGHGEEPFWVATIFAKDELTGMVLPGSSMEPQRMRLKADTAAKKRRAGMKIPEDNTIFDRFARTKAIQKATRNALAGFIPEAIEQSVIGMFLGDPSRVQRIQTEAEAKVAELPPPLTDDKAKALVAECEALYDRIREAGQGQGKIVFPPARYAAWLMQSQHDHGALERFVEYLKGRLAEIAAQFAESA